MKKVARIGSVADQDKWRREDVLRMTPSERVDLVFDMMEDMSGSRDIPMVRIAKVRSHVPHSR